MIPGVGPINSTHVGAAVGLVNGVTSHLVGLKRPTRDAKQEEIATAARRDPLRHAADLLLYTQNRKRYEELARARRLPSQVWAGYEANGQLERHLRAVHERDGESLRQLYRDRPTGERAILGLAAATGTTDDVVRALDALRVHPHYPARASFARLVDGFAAPEVARIASAFLPGGNAASVVEVYQGVHEARERAHIERRRGLLRRLRAEWATAQPALVPLFEAITRGYSPAQVERLRRELERSGEVETVFEQIETANLRRRLDAVEAAFQRWLAEWEASRLPTVQTPMQEPFVLADGDPPPSPSVPPAQPPSAIDSESDYGESDDSERQLAIQRAPEMPEAPDPPPAGVVVDAEDDAGAPYALRAPPPGAHAADGVLPWRYLTHGFGRVAEERLRGAWDVGRPWDVYRELLLRRGAARRAAREGIFLRHLEELGCRVPGPCRLEREQLAVLAPLSAGFSPEQWARLASALTEGAIDPLAVWREIERENLAEAISVREAAFLRYMGAWGHAPRYNPLEWTCTAPRLGPVLLDPDTSGLIDELRSALGSFGGEDGFDANATRNQGIGALFGAGGGGPQGAAPPLGGELGAFAEQAIGILTGRATPTRPKGGPSRVEAEAGSPAAGGDPADVLSSMDRALGALLGGQDAPGAAPPPPPGSFDLPRVLAPWLGQGLFGERVVRGLEGVGLTDLATALPQELLRVTAGRRPKNADPSQWWHELTAGQGLSEKAEARIRRAIDTDGPEGIERTIATYSRLLEGAVRAQAAQREALFAKILAAAQGVGGPAFDPARLPGGDPFVLLSRSVRGWPRVVEAMKRGDNPLGVFRQIEDERVNRLLRVQAPEWMRRMLEALWAQREEAGWIPGGEVGDPDAVDAGDPAQADAGSSDASALGDADAGAFEDADAGDAEGEAGDGNDAGDADESGDGERDVGDVGDANEADEAGYGDEAGDDVAPDAGDPRLGVRPQPGYDRPLTRPRYGSPPPPAARVPVRGPVRVIREPVRVVDRGPVRGIGLPIRPIVRGPIVRERARFYDPFRDLRGRWPVREIVRPVVSSPFRWIGRGPNETPFLGYGRPRPLYHLSFARPMSERELRRLLMLVPPLRAHPPGVLAEMAGLVGQARDVRGVDATTGEYLLLPGETLIDVAFKLVGDRRRWVELLAANPMRAHGDPRLRIPPSWFGYVPYSIPLRRARELLARRWSAETGEPDEAGDADEGAFDDAGDADEAAFDDAGDAEEAGAMPWRRRRRTGRRRARGMRGPGSVVVAGPAVAVEPPEEEDGDDPQGEDAGDPDLDAFRSELVLRSDVRAPGTPDYPRAVAEAIAIRHGLWDGERWLRPNWWAELRDANPHKPLGPRGWWRDVVPGEELGIPRGWPIFKPRSTGSDTGHLRDELASDTGSLDDTGAGEPRQNLTTRAYAVVAGDGMQRIAQKLGAASRPHWFGELRDANPQKAMKLDAKGRQIGWESLYAGEILNVPDAWPDTPQLRPPPGGTPTPAPHSGLSQFPTFPGGAVPSPTAPPGTVPAAASVDPGVILRVQSLLAGFGRLHPEAIVPRDFGAGVPFSPDITGVLTTRTQSALVSFQRWSNVTTGSRLRTDGVLDPDTIAALDSYSAQVLGELAQRPPALPAAGAPRSVGDATDPFAGLFKAPRDNGRGDPPEPAPSAPVRVPPRRPAPMAPPWPLPESLAPGPVLQDLQDALQQYGIPGVPGLPGGAPHAPRPERPRREAPVAPPAAEVHETSPDVPPQASAPAPSPKKAGDDGVVPMVLAGLGIVSGLFV